jgi:hypothetical protein
MLRKIGLLAVLVSASGGMQEASGQDPVRCLSLSSIDHTEVIDDQTIAFYLRGGRIYLNRLDRACRNLDRDRPFSYRTATGQLCANDVINVIEDFGPGPIFGDTCGLEHFVPTDEEEVEILKGERDAVDVEPEEVEPEEGEPEDVEPDETEADE